MPPRRPTKRPGESEESYQGRLRTWVAQVGTRPQPAPAAPESTSGPEEAATAPQVNPFGGGPLPPELLATYPQQEDYTYPDYRGGPEVYHPGPYLAAMDSWMGMAANFAEYGEIGFGPVGLTPEELGIEREKIGVSREGLDIQRQGVQAQNLASYLDATVAQIQAEIAAGQLRLDQAQAEFDRRMDAFTEGGAQMAEMWQWTVPQGATTVHGDLRAGLGMTPWESQAVPFDPYAMAWQIMEESPGIEQRAPSLDPLNQALKMMEQFL